MSAYCAILKKFLPETTAVNLQLTSMGPSCAQGVLLVLVCDHCDAPLFVDVTDLQQESSNRTIGTTGRKILHTLFYWDTLPATTTAKARSVNDYVSTAMLGSTDDDASCVQQ